MDAVDDLDATIKGWRTAAWTLALGSLVVVGALHLVGRNSVVDLLEKRGYDVVQQ